jgi:hypothetical protein
VSTYDVGDTIRLPFTAKDPAGVLVDAAGISVAVTDPSGVTTTPAVVHDGVGLYHADYGPAVLPGRYRFRWIPPNGSNVGATPTSSTSSTPTRGSCCPSTTPASSCASRPATPSTTKTCASTSPRSPRSSRTSSARRPR